MIEQGLELKDVKKKVVKFIHLLNVSKLEIQEGR